FGPVLKTQVYAFALVVSTYLGATFAGSWLYRRHLRRRAVRPTGEMIGWLCTVAFLPVLANDPRFVESNWSWYADPKSVALLLASLCPFCGLLGYLTPGLVDQYAAGSPAAAGKAYAINVLGCILGPLVASYILLPRMSERHALLVLGLPFFVFFFLGYKDQPRKPGLGLGLAGGAALAAGM